MIAGCLRALSAIDTNAAVAMSQPMSFSKWCSSIGDQSFIHSALQHKAKPHFSAPIFPVHLIALPPRSLTPWIFGHISGLTPGPDFVRLPFPHESPRHQIRSLLRLRYY